jgi:hypothetical protein
MRIFILAFSAREISTASAGINFGSASLLFAQSFEGVRPAPFFLLILYIRQYQRFHKFFYKRRFAVLTGPTTPIYMSPLVFCAYIDNIHNLPIYCVVKCFITKT